MKTIIGVGLAVVAGGVGAFLFMKYRKKKGDCGCGGGSSTTAAGGSTSQPVSTLPSTATPPIIAPGAVSSVAADGKSGWIKTGKHWY